MVADKREFIRLDVGYFDNPKIADAMDESHLAPLAHLASMAYCRQHRTDGVFAISRILRKVGASAADAKVLLDLGLWVDLGDGKAELHDYLKHQESAEQIARLSEAGKKGAASRWGKSRSTDRSTDRNAEERRGEERRKEATASYTGHADRIPDEPPQDDPFPQPEMSVNNLLATSGLSQHEHRDFLVALKGNGARNTTALVNALYRDGKLPARIAEWRSERDLATEAASRPAKPTRISAHADLVQQFAAQEAAANVVPIRQIEGA